MLLDRTQRNGRQPNAHALALMLERTATMMGRYQLERAIERVPPGVETHVIRPPASMNEATLDFDHAASWIDLAYQHAKAYLEQSLPHHQLPALEGCAEATSRAG